MSNEEIKARERKKHKRKYKNRDLEMWVEEVEIVVIGTREERGAVLSKSFAGESEDASGVGKEGVSRESLMYQSREVCSPE